METTERSDVAIEARYAELRKMLEGRRRDLMDAVRCRIRGVRAKAAKDRDVLDEGDTSAADMQEDIELALFQMQSETLSMVADALRRLDESTYGQCLECGAEIAEARLRALPFALRCRNCEEAREISQQRSHCPGSAGYRSRSSSTCQSDRAIAWTAIGPASTTAARVDQSDVMKTHVAFSEAGASRNGTR